MKRKDAVAGEAAPSGEHAKRQARMNLPGFIRDDVGLGDALTYVTRSVGIPTCGGCTRRAQLLNSWVNFKGRGS